MHPRVWEASGHVEGFTDPLVECKNCHRRFRADNPEVQDGQCPVCGTRDAFGEPRQFNLMFKTFMGPVESQASVVYLRPETAQGIFVNFQNVLTSSRQRVPFGIAQIGKAFRNEITPGNFIFRTREFEQMELEFFVEPGTDEEWHEYWPERWDWYVARVAGQLRPRHPGELSHYKAVDIEYGSGSARSSGGSQPHRLRPDPASGVLGQAAGVRIREPGQAVHTVHHRDVGRRGPHALVVLADAYREEVVEGETRVVLALSPRLAPIKVAVFPLVKKDGMPEMAEKIHKAFRAAGIPSFYDDSGSIGRRYRRQDEAGTPFAITVDGQSLEDGSVTVRDRDTLAQDGDAGRVVGTCVRGLREVAACRVGGIERRVWVGRPCRPAAPSGVRLPSLPPG